MKKDHLVKPRFIEKKKMFFYVFFEIWTKIKRKDFMVTLSHHKVL